MSDAQQQEEEQRILATLREALVELFGTDPARVTPEARLAEDLEIDSIDAVDLVDHMRRTTGQKLSAEDFRAVRTIGDLVASVRRLLHSPRP